MLFLLPLDLLYLCMVPLDEGGSPASKSDKVCLAPLRTFLEMAIAIAFDMVIVMDKPASPSNGNFVLAEVSLSYVKSNTWPSPAPWLMSSCGVGDGDGDGDDDGDGDGEGDGEGVLTVLSLWIMATSRDELSSS